MAASVVFMNLIKSIEDSNLNYSISRTPYSATISLKSSFLRRIPGDSQVSVSEEYVKSPRNFPIDMKNVKLLEAANPELSEKINCLKLSHTEQKRQMEELANLKIAYDDEKKVTLSQESKIAKFRDEILKIKKERKELNAKLITANEKCETFEVESKDYIKENEVHKREIENMAKKIELKDEEVLRMKREHNVIKEQLIQEVQTDLELRKCEAEKEINDAKNSHNKASQYEELRDFEMYNCFYCDTTIDSEESLKTHSLTCHDKECEQSTMNQNVRYPCEVCGAKCHDSDDLERHLQTYHWVEVGSEDFESCKYQCEICPLNFDKKRDLDFHVRGFHRGDF